MLYYDGMLIKPSYSRHKLRPPPAFTPFFQLVSLKCTRDFLSGNPHSLIR